MLTRLLTSWFFCLSLLALINNGKKERSRNYLRPPVNISRTGNITNVELRVKAHTQTIYGRDNKPVANLTIRAYEYNGSTNFVGPTFHAHPGDLINITLINDLIGVGRMTQIDKLLGTSLNRVSYKDPDVTNIHLHGLHVDPNVDNIALWVSPKCSTKINSKYWNKLDCYINETAEPRVVNSLNYPYRIPRDHYPGTHWYHAHKHGSVTFDLMSGIYGLFIVDDITYPPPMIDIELLIGFIWLHGGELCRDKILKPHNGVIRRNIQCTGTGRDNRPHAINGNVKYPFNFPIQSACFINCRMQYELKYPFNFSDGTKWTQLNASDIGIYPVDLDPNYHDIGYNDTNGTQYFLINGQIEPIIKIDPSNWYHFRMVNTLMNYLLFWVANDTTAKNCEFSVMGQDGIYFKDGPRDLYSFPYQQRKVILPPGSRADIAVRCQCYLNESIDGFCDYQIYASSKFDTPEIDKFVPLPLNDTLLFTMEVLVSNTSNRANWKPQPYSTTSYLSDTRKAKSNPFCSAGDYSNMTQCNFVQGRQIYPAGKPRLQSLESINQFTFNVSKILAKVCTDEVLPHEWLVTNNFHPIHQHTWPFQIQSDITSGWVAMDGDWRDTVGASGTIRIRSNYVTDDFSYKNYNFSKGIIVMHCHYVPHEDHGMMALVEGTKNCSSIKGKYIVPVNSNTSNVFPNTTAVPTIINCIPRNATAILQLNDVGCYMNIQLTINQNCYFELSFTVIPRSEAIGNLWVGIAVDGKQPPFNSSNPNYWADMAGDALIVSILSSDYNKPLTQLTSEEVHLETRRRLAIIYKDNYFNCDNNFKSDSGTLSWKCVRPFCSTCNEKFGTTWMALNDGNRHFAFAYGEGQFIRDKTYHSSKGGCVFYDSHTVHCNQTQNI